MERCRWLAAGPGKLSAGALRNACTGNKTWARFLMRTVISSSCVDQNSRANSGRWSPKHGCWLCPGAGEVCLAGGGVCLYCFNFTKPERVSRTAGQSCTVIQLGSPRSQPASGRKESEQEGKALSTTACLFQPRCSVCPVLDITLLLGTFLLVRFSKDMVSSALRHGYG